MAEQNGNGNGRARMPSLNDARVYLGGILLVMGVAGTYVVGFITSLEQRFVTAREFAAAQEIVGVKLDAMATSLRDLRESVSQIPRLSAQLDNLKQQLAEQRRETRELRLNENGK